MKLKYLFYAQCLINYLMQKGIPSTDINKVFGISKNCLDPMENEPTIENIHELTMYFKEKTGISHCGMEMIMRLGFQSTGFFGSYALSCSTLGEAFNKTFAVHKAVNTLFNYEMIPEDRPQRFVYKLDRSWEASHPDSAREIVEFGMANGLYFTRKLIRQEIRPRSISFTYSMPGDVTVYEEFYQCPVSFNEPRNEAVYHEEIMDYSIPSYNPTLLEILEDIAYQLNTSKRSLQSKLKEHGTTFKQVLEDVLKDLSISYLQSNQTSNKEIAWLLGYTDLANFYRAFKRWTGQTPNGYRKTISN